MSWLHPNRATRESPDALAFTARTGGYQITGVWDWLCWLWQERTCTWDHPCTPPLRRTGPSIANTLMSDIYGMEWPPKEYRECQRGHTLSRERIDWECEDLLDQARWDWEAAHPCRDARQESSR